MMENNKTKNTADISAKQFIETVLGRELNEGLDIFDADYFVGEKVGAFLAREEYETKAGKTREKMTPVQDSFYTVD